MIQEWSSWSGNIRFTPAQIATPETEEQVIQLVQQAIAEQRTIRTVGSSHSCSFIFKTDDMLLSTEKLQGVESCDLATKTAIAKSGTKIHQLSQTLH